MRVRVLGSCRVEGHEPLGRRDRVVLAALEIGGSAPTPAATLAEALYGDDPPPTWRKVVQGSVLRLRQALGARAIETTPDGYRLALGDDDVDARRFERSYERAADLVEVGQAARAVPLLREALELFQGVPFGELDGWGPGRDESARLLELSRRAEERLAEALLSEGRVDEATTLAAALASKEPLREQRWVLLAQAYYRSERQADALRAVDRARRLLREELGVDPGPALVAIERAVLEHDPSLGPSGAVARQASALCPYKGLLPYDVGDADEFFGREDDIAACVGRLSSAGVLAIVGPSGRGKSSLARAGLVPAIRRRGQAVVVFTPGADPVARLGGVPLDTAVVVDQLEELFTITSSEAERAAFADGLSRRAVRAPIVLTLRADFVAAVSGLPSLAGLVEDGLYLLGPMTEAQVRAAITGPATRAGLRLEPGLVDLLVRDVDGQAGALPLLSHALAETWAHREDRVLTVAGYQAGGGVEGAVAATADGVLDRLSPDGRRSARALFLRLVSLSDAGAPISHRVRRADLVHGHPHDDVVDALLAGRLLTADAESVEVAHEALGRAWPRLRSWLDEDREGQRILRHLATTSAEWERSGRDDAELYRGGRLRTAEEWVAAATPDLTVSEQAFLDQSVVRRRAEEDDLADQAARQRRANRRLRLLLAGVGVLLVLALLSGGLFLGQRNRAEETARAATARQLASESSLALEQDPQLGILLALEAVEATRSAGEPALPEALSALQRATQASRVELHRDEGANFVDAQADGVLAVSGSTDPMSAVVWSAATGDKLWTLRGPGATVSDVAISPDGRLVAVGYEPSESETAAAVILWDAATGKEVSRVPSAGRLVYGLTFSPDGRLLAWSSEQTDTPARIVVWDVASASERVSFEPAGGTGPVAFRADPPSLVIGELDERIGVYSLENGDLLDVLPTPGFESANGIALDETGQLVALSSQASLATQLWNLQTGQRLWSIDGEAGPLDWSPKGDRLAIAGGNQSPIRVVNPATGDEAMVLRGHESGSWDVAFTAGGDRLVSGAAAGGVRVWDVTDDGAAALRALVPESGYPFAVQFSPDGSEMVAFTREGAMERIGREAGEVLGTLTDQKMGLPTYFPEASLDWSRVATVSASDGSAVIRDLRTLEPVATLPRCTSPIALSPDGSLVVVDGFGLCTNLYGSIQSFEPAADTVLRSRVINVATGEVALDLGERVITEATFNPEGRFPAGRYLAVDVGNEFIEIYDMATGALVTSLEFRDDYPFGMSFDPEGKWLAGGTAGGRAWVLDIAAVVAGTAPADAMLFDQAAHQGVNLGHALSADGLLATAGVSDGRVKLWDVSSSELVVELETKPSDPSHPVEFSPDGSYVLYNDGGVLRRYLLEADELVELAQRRLIRGFTPDECRQYLSAGRCDEAA